MAMAVSCRQQSASAIRYGITLGPVDYVGGHSVHVWDHNRDSAVFFCVDNVCIKDIYCYCPSSFSATLWLKTGCAYTFSSVSVRKSECAARRMSLLAVPFTMSYARWFMPLRR